MKHWKTILGITGIFILGMMAGSLLTIKTGRRFIERGPEGRLQVIERRLTRRLDLDDAQREQLRKIVRNARQEFKTARENTQPQVRTILDKSENQVRAILRPGQLEKFDKLMAERKAKWQQQAGEN